VESPVREEVGALYDAFFGEIYAYCAYRLYRRDLAEDAAAAVFLKLVQNYHKVGGRGRNGTRNWLYGTASNVVKKHLRDTKRQKLIAEALQQDLAEGSRKRSSAGTDDRWPAVYEAFSDLGAVDQALVALRYFSGLESPEIAEIAGMKPVAVRVRLLRAIRTLRRRLGVQDD
jgi:RNA polymerase sigma-70 factor (ECF subfamily)